MEQIIIDVFLSFVVVEIKSLLTQFEFIVEINLISISLKEF